MTDQTAKPTTLELKRLELIRQLESQSYIFATSPKTATATAKTTDGTPFAKLLKRAELIDSDNTLKSALQKSEFFLNLAGRMYGMAGFALGFLGVFGLLSTHFVSFFYVLAGLLGWHTVTLIVWFAGLQNSHSYNVLYLVIDKLKPRKPLESTAFDIHLQEFKRHDTWQIGKIIHQAWLFGLLGSMLALILLFLFKSYALVWESTLLNTEHFMQILAVIGFIPSLFGLPVPDVITADSNRYLATIMIISVFLYGMLPRFVAYAYCYLKANKPFELDKNLYYYENLLRQFNQKLADKDDFIPTKPRPAPAIISPDTKIVATLERSSDEGRYHFGAGHNVEELGVLDSKDDITRAIERANTLKAQIYLGIDPHSLPDRGVLRKFDTLLQGGQYGLVVEFLGEGDHLDTWREALIARGVQEVRR